MPARDAALELARRLKAAGHEALFAGGCVRDRLLGHPPKDYDIATSAMPAEVLELFPGSNEVGAHFGVVIAKHGGHHVEIATFRTDGSYQGRPPAGVRHLLHPAGRRQAPGFHHQRPVRSPGNRRGDRLRRRPGGPQGRRHPRHRRSRRALPRGRPAPAARRAFRRPHGLHHRAGNRRRAPRMRAVVRPNLARAHPR